MNLTLTFDGGAAPNPGKAYGSYLVESDSGFKVQASRVQFGDNLTNNQAEWLSLISGLKNALVALQGEYYGQKFGHPRKCFLTIRSDSKLVVQQLKRRWKCKVVHLVELRAKADLLLEEFGGWKAEWHPRARSVELFGH